MRFLFAWLYTDRYIYMMEAERSKAERTRQFIIETTAGLFNTKGYAGTSMSDIEQATGLTKGSIYGNFQNKEAVALAVFDYNHSRMNELIRRHVQKAVTYYDKLMVYAGMHELFIHPAFPQGGCPILNTAIEADDTNHLLKEKAAEAVVRWRKSIEEIIKKGIQAGEFRDGLDASQIALSIIALVEGSIMIAKVTNNQGYMKKILQSVQTLINGISA